MTNKTISLILAVLFVSGIWNNAGAAPIISNGGQTVTIDAIGDMFDVTYFEDTQTQDGDPILGTLATTIWYELTNFANDIATFDITIQNNSSGGQNGRVVSFGFDVVPDLNAGSATNSWQVALGPNIGDPFFTVDLCVFIGNNCNGGGSGGVTPGNTDTTTLSLTYDPGTVLATGLDFSTPFIRYQSVTAQNIIQCDGDPPPDADCLSAKLGGEIVLTAVPIPSATLLFVTGLAGLLLFKRRDVFQNR